MAEVRWIKIVTNIFDDEKIRYIESLPSGDQMVVIWFRILCLSGKSNSSGFLMMTDRLAYTEEMLASIFNRDLKEIQLSLSVFESLEMIEVIDDKIYLRNWEKHQSTDKLEKIREQTRKRVQDHRDRLKLESNATQPLHVTHCNDTELELDLEKDLKNNTKDMGKNIRFVPPTLDEVREYIEKQGYSVDAEKFIDFYQSKGWMVGKNKMKDWKASVRTWSKEKGSSKGRVGRVEIVTDYSKNQTTEKMSDDQLRELEESLKRLG